MEGVEKKDCQKHIYNFTKKMDDLKDDVNQIKIDVLREIGSLKDHISNEMKDMKKEADSSYAPIWTAQALKLVMGAVTLALIAAGLSVVLK